MLYHLLAGLIFSLLLMMMVSGMKSRTAFSFEKSTPFECGFDPKDSARVPFSMRFFLLAIIFLIFDIEVALLFPFLMMFSNGSQEAFVVLFFFLLILLLGVVHEWAQGSLSWVS